MNVLRTVIGLGILFGGIGVEAAGLQTLGRDFFLIGLLVWALGISERD